VTLLLAARWLLLALLVLVVAGLVRASLRRESR
jgi:hypothetical protein